jgi:cell division protein FtsB
MAKNNFEKIISITDEVLAYPSRSLKEACKKFGLDLSPRKIMLGRALVEAAAFVNSPAVFAVVWSVRKYLNSKREKQEKERMYNEIICRQQAIIEKLKRENEYNKEEIKNLKDTLTMLEYVLDQMKAE